MFKYKLVYFDEFLDTENKSHTISGYVVGVDTFEDAVEVLCRWYGEKNVEKIERLELIADNRACLELKPSSSFLDVEQHFEEYEW